MLNSSANASSWRAQTSRSSRDRASAGKRSPGRQHPQHTCARSHAMSAHPARTRRATARPSSTARTPPDPSHPRGRSHRTPTRSISSTDASTNHANMLLRQPIPRVRRHQEHLLTITLKKVLDIPRMVLNPSDGPGVCATPTTSASRTSAGSRHDRLRRGDAGVSPSPVGAPPRRPTQQVSESTTYALAVVGMRSPARRPKTQPSVREAACGGLLREHKAGPRKGSLTVWAVPS